MTKCRVAIWTIAGGQMLLLVTMIVIQEYRLRTWHTIRLQVQPVDPEALFRGRYVDLAYDFSILEGGETELRTGDTVYVELRARADGLWEYAGFSTKLEHKPGNVVLRGEVESSRRRAKRVRMNIESYFLSERQAPQIDRLSQTQYPMTVDVVIAPDGRAALKQLYVRGIPAEKFDPGSHPQQ